jgi:hypothetical protein
MKVFAQMFLVAIIALSTSACSIRHFVELDYPQYLVNNAGQTNLPKTDKAAEYFLTPATQQHRYEFRAALTGAAHLWIVEFGKMLDDTLMSADVQKAFSSLRKISDMSAASNNLLIFDLQDYTFANFSAHVSLKISLFRAGQVVFSKTYTQDGKSQGGKMFWGGAFAQKNAVQQSTKFALDEILRQLIADLDTYPK